MLGILGLVARLGFHDEEPLLEQLLASARQAEREVGIGIGILVAQAASGRSPRPRRGPRWPGRGRLRLAHPVQGLDNYHQLIEALTSGKNVIKAFCEIAPLDTPVGSAVANGLAHAR